jgi:hypothetical protein
MESTSSVVGELTRMWMPAMADGEEEPDELSVVEASF